MKKILSPIVFVSTAMLLVLNACMVNNDKSEVVDPATMGASLSGSSGYLGGWEKSLSSATDSIPSTGTSMNVTLSKISTLAKISVAAGNTVTVDSSTKAQGYVTIAVKIPGLLGFQTTYDTAVVKYDSKYQDAIQNNENVIRFSQTVVWQDAGTGLPNGASDRAEFSDADGDSLLNIVVAGSRVRVVFTHVAVFLGKQLTATGTVVVGPGSDNNFNTDDDNVVYQAVWARTWSGRTDSLYFRNKTGTGTIVAGDTMHLIAKTTSSASGDTLKSVTVDIAFNPGANLKSPNDDLFYSIHVTSHKQGRFERDGDFTFTPSSPVPHGQQAQSGSFSASVTFSNDKTATLTGTFSSTGYQATYTGPDGAVKVVQYTKAGAVVSEE